MILTGKEMISIGNKCPYSRYSLSLEKAIAQAEHEATLKGMGVVMIPVLEAAKKELMMYNAHHSVSRTQYICTVQDGTINLIDNAIESLLKDEMPK